MPAPVNPASAGRVQTSKRVAIVLAAFLTPPLLLLACHAESTWSWQQQARTNEQRPRLLITYLGTRGAAGGGDLTVSAWTDARLVPPGQARNPDDLHLVFLLDSDVEAYRRDPGGIPLPAAGPNVVHTAETSATFRDVPPGRHQVAVLLSDPNHQSVGPLALRRLDVRAGEDHTHYRYSDEDSLEAKLPAALVLGGLYAGVAFQALRRREQERHQ